MGYLIKIALLFAPGGIPILLLLFLYKLVKGKQEDKNMTVSVYELEKHLMPRSEWDSIPLEAHAMFREVLNESLEDACKCGGVGVGHTEETGWFILMSGQGPFIAWMEHESRGTYRMSSDGRQDLWVTVTKE